LQDSEQTEDTDALSFHVAVNVSGIKKAPAWRSTYCCWVDQRYCWKFVDIVGRL